MTQATCTRWMQRPDRSCGTTLSGANCNGGAAIVGGMVFWGTGYDAFALTGGSTQQGLYAFGLSD